MKMLRLNDISQDQIGRYGMVGISQVMKELYLTIEKISKTPVWVYLLGESGSGKEKIARAIHDANPITNNKPYVAFNINSVTESLFEKEFFGHIKGAFTDAKTDKTGIIELSSEGTLFLDEIGKMLKTMQGTLLRVLDENHFYKVGDYTNPIKPNFYRLIIASSESITEKVKTGEFLDEFIYRVIKKTIKVPAVRERNEDKIILADYFLYQICQRYNINHKLGFSNDALNFINEYPWPGNVREMKNILEATVASCYDQSILNRTDLESNIITLNDFNLGNKPKINPDEYQNLINNYELLIEKLQQNNLLKTIFADDPNILKILKGADQSESLINNINSNHTNNLSSGLNQSNLEPKVKPEPINNTLVNNSPLTIKLGKTELSFPEIDLSYIDLQKIENPKVEKVYDLDRGIFIQCYSTLRNMKNVKKINDILTYVNNHDDLYLQNLNIAKKPFYLFYLTAKNYWAIINKATPDNITNYDHWKNKGWETISNLEKWIENGFSKDQNFNETKKKVFMPITKNKFKGLNTLWNDYSKLNAIINNINIYLINPEDKNRKYLLTPDLVPHFIDKRIEGYERTTAEIQENIMLNYIENLSTVFFSDLSNKPIKISKEQCCYMFEYDDISSLDFKINHANVEIKMNLNGGTNDHQLIKEYNIQGIPILLLNMNNTYYLSNNGRYNGLGDQISFSEAVQLVGDKVSTDPYFSLAKILIRNNFEKDRPNFIRNIDGTYNRINLEKSIAYEKVANLFGL